MEDRRTTQLTEAIAAVGVTLGEPDGPDRWQGRDGTGPVLVTAVRPGSRVHHAALLARVGRLVDLDHRGLAQVRAAFVVSGEVVVVQRELSGTDLATVLRGRADWRPGEVAGLVADIAEAVATLHAAGLVHGDVAPATILVDDDGRGVLAGLLSGADAADTGTPGFAAPGRADGATRATDVWSVGAVARALLERCVEPPDALVAVVVACTDPDPGARPTAEEAAERLLASTTAEPVRPVDPSRLAGALLQEEAARHGPPDRSEDRSERPSGRRRRMRLVAASAVAVTVAGGLALAMWQVGIPFTDNPATSAASSPAPSVPVDPDPTPTDEDPGAVTGAEVTGDTLDESTDATGARTDPDPTADPSVAAPQDSEEAAAQAAVDLTLRRAAALAEGDLLTLLSVTEPGSPAAAADRAAWERGGVEATTVTVDDVQVLGRSAGEWRVRVHVRAGDATQDVVLRLVTADGRWYVRAVGPA